jgi:hypothetical protein
MIQTDTIATESATLHLYTHSASVLPTSMSIEMTTPPPKTPPPLTTTTIQPADMHIPPPPAPIWPTNDPLHCREPDPEEEQRRFVSWLIKERKKEIEKGKE